MWSSGRTRRESGRVRVREVEVGAQASRARGCRPRCGGGLGWRVGNKRLRGGVGLLVGVGAVVERNLARGSRRASCCCRWSRSGGGRRRGGLGRGRGRSRGGRSRLGRGGGGRRRPFVEGIEARLRAVGSRMVGLRVVALGVRRRRGASLFAARFPVA